MAKRDYYEVLGIPKTASDDEIKKAYKNMAKRFHPDLNQDDAGAEDKLKEVNEAYEILGNPDSRSRYDQFGHAGTDPNAGFGGGGGGFGGAGGFGMEDIFSSFFGGGTGPKNGPQQGNDLRTDVTIEFEQAATGLERDINVTRLESCNVCGGSGAEPGSHPNKCPQCGGTGKMRVNQQTPFGQFQTVRTCNRCNGAGTIIDHPCKECGGGGKVRRNRKLKIKIPAGVDNGSRLRMAGEGEGGTMGGPAGDLYIYVTVRPHEFFKRSEDDVVCEFPISFVQATLGSEIEVPTLEGKVKLTIPEGTQSGTVFRMKGKGFPRLRGYGKGDQHVKIKIVTPTNLTEEQKHLLREFDPTVIPVSREEKKGFFGKKKK